MAKLYYYGVCIEVPCSTAAQAKRVVLDARLEDVTVFIKGMVIEPNGSTNFKVEGV